jgi:hypothetical protein
LHRAVLPEGAVQNRQHDVDLAERRGWCGVGDHGKRLDARCGQLLVPRRQLPAACLVDFDDDGLVARRIERVDHGAGGRNGDLVLARAAAREHGDANARRHGVVVVSVST